MSAKVHQNITCFGDATKKHLDKLESANPELAPPDLLCIQEAHLMGQEVDKTAKWLEKRLAMTSNWSQGRPGDGKGVLGGTSPLSYQGLSSVSPRSYGT